MHALPFVGKRCAFVRANKNSESHHAMLKCDAVWVASIYCECTRSATGFSSGWLRHCAGKEGMLADGTKCRLPDSSHSVTSMDSLCNTSTACVLNCRSKAHAILFIDLNSSYVELVFVKSFGCGHWTGHLQCRLSFV